MARGKQTKPNNNLANKAMPKQPLIKPEHMGAFQQECKRVMQKLCEDNSTTIINVSDRFNKLYANMEKIQEAHKKKSGWKLENDLVNGFSMDERLKNAEKLITELSEKHDLPNLKNIKVVKEFEGLGLRKQMQDADKAKDQDSNFIRIPAESMLTSNSECKSKDFEKFITTDRMTSAMMNVRLALRLIYHRYDKQSEFKSYMDQLPNDYSTPLYWKPDDFQCLHTGFEACNEEALTSYKFFTTIARQYLYFLTVFNNIPSLKKFYQYFTWDSYKWAVSTVQTRANQLEKTTLGFIPVLELCNTNLKSELVVGRLYTEPELEAEEAVVSEETAAAVIADKASSDEKENTEPTPPGDENISPEEKKEKLKADQKLQMQKMMDKAKEEQRKMPKLLMAELDITSIGNNKSIYFSYTGNANNRTSLQSLIHNALSFKEKVEVTVHLPQSKPLHKEKISYMKAVGGDDFNKEACLSPLVKIKTSDSKQNKEFSLLQMVHFLVVALDKDPEPTEEDKKKQAEEEAAATAVAAIKAKEKEEEDGKNNNNNNNTTSNKDDEIEEIKREGDIVKEDAPAKVYPFNYKNEDLKPKAKQFLKIRLSVLKRYLDKVDYELFTHSVLRSYVEAKRNLFEELINMVDTV